MRRYCTGIVIAIAQAGACPALAAPPAAGSGDYPNRSIRVLVPHAPGGPTDIMARVVGQRLSESLGHPVVIDNRPGAGGNIGTALVARAPADGYTVLCNSSAFAVNVSLFAKPGYDIRDFEPVINGGVIANLIFAHPSLPASNLQELIRLGRTKKLAYASSGMGTTPHLTVERLLKTMAGLDVTHIPYNGAALATNAVVSAEVPIGTAAVTAPAPMLKAGKLKGIVVTSLKRTAALPDVPTAAESGFPGYEDYTWIAFFAPRGTPRAVVERLNADIAAALRTQVVTERLAVLGFEFMPNTPAEFAKYLNREVAKWGKVVKDSGARVD
ncbi:MAG: tripartite tricarboxylate transporter substrate binding protein [Burkholderiales bacterium]|nr:tripartite tricarboxylate transporter substrate binding protein [Burkholderiales bacterium]